VALLAQKFGHETIHHGAEGRDFLFLDLLGDSLSLGNRVYSGPRLLNAGECAGPGICNVRDFVDSADRFANLLACFLDARNR
jgi:hypothetical protein